RGRSQLVAEAHRLEEKTIEKAWREVDEVSAGRHGDDELADRIREFRGRALVGLGGHDISGNCGAARTLCTCVACHPQSGRAASRLLPFSADSNQATGALRNGDSGRGSELDSSSHRVVILPERS